MKHLIAIIILFVLVSCKEKGRKLPYYDTADFTPKWEMADKSTFHAIRKFSLTDQEGNVFTEKSIDGKICVADFFFTILPRYLSKAGNQYDSVTKRISK